MAQRRDHQLLRSHDFIASRTAQAEVTVERHGTQESPGCPLFQYLLLDQVARRRIRAGEARKMDKEGAPSSWSPNESLILSPVGYIPKGYNSHSYQP